MTDEQLGRYYRELIERQHACAVELGWASYVDMCEHCKGIDLRALSEQTAAFADASASAYPRVLEPELRRTLGIGMGELRRVRPPALLPGARAGPLLPSREVDRELHRDDARASGSTSPPRPA